MVLKSGGMANLFTNIIIYDIIKSVIFSGGLTADLVKIMKLAY